MSNGNTVENIGDWYVRISACDGYGAMATSTVAVGKFHINKRGMVIQERTLKRFSYSNGDKKDRDRAIEEAKKWIKNKV